MSYVDGFVLPLHREKIDEYRKVAEIAQQVWMELGALEYVECIADDVPEGELTSFPRSVQLQPYEVVIFSWIRYASRDDRDRIMKQVMEDPRMAFCHGPDSMPFDGKRMIWGGFKILTQSQ